MVGAERPQNMENWRVTHKFTSEHVLHRVLSVRLSWSCILHLCEIVPLVLSGGFVDLIWNVHNDFRAVFAV